MRRIVCTGWYCGSDEHRNYITHGSDKIRTIEFRKLWLESVNKFLAPDLIFVVNSNSQQKPVFDSTKEEWCDLTINPGHPQNTSFKFSGWTTSVLIGLEFSLASKVDYFLYVEQDCLVYGASIIEEIEKALKKKPYVFGKAKNRTQPLEQSFFAIKRDFISEFISNLHMIKQSDKIVGPEYKFLMAVAGRRTIFINNVISNIHPSLGFRFRRYVSYINKLNFLPFGYGRIRPINFKDSNFYFQHGSIKEIQYYKKKLNNLI